jgi:hypothetical protein
VIGNTLRAFANGRKDDWDRQLSLAVFAINNAQYESWLDKVIPLFVNLPCQAS